LAKGETTSLPQNRVLYGLGDSKFDDGLGRNLDLLFRLGIEAGASLPFLLYDLAKAGQDGFAVLFDRFVGEVADYPRYNCSARSPFRRNLWERIT